MKGPLKLVLIALVSALAGYLAYHYVLETVPPELSRTEFLVEVVAGRVHKVEIKDQEVITGESSTRGKFRTAFHKDGDEDLLEELKKEGVEVSYASSGLTLF
jgi:hypothetical protein